MKTKLTIYIFLISFAIFGQSFTEKYEDIDDVTSVIVTEEMFKMLGSITPEGENAKEEIEALKDLTGLIIISTDNPQYKDQMLKDAQNYIQKKNMKELLRINDKEANVKFYVIKGDKDYIAKELVMIVVKKTNPAETVIMDLTGTIDLRKLSKLNSKVNMVDKKYFEEVEQKMNHNE